MRKLIFKRVKWLKEIKAIITTGEYVYVEGLAKLGLMNIWEYARKYVPYYQDSPPFAWNAIPILTRDILNKEGLNLASVTRFNRRPYWNATGGSTGQPVRFIQDREYQRWNIASKVHYLKQAGIELGDLQCRIWGIDRINWKKRLNYWAINRKEFQGFCLTEREMDRYARWIEKHNPVLIEGYTDSLYEFCLHVDRRLSSPKAVFVGGGTLYPHMRTKIEQTFGCKVYNRYGSRELSPIACDCPEGNMHVSSWNAYVEIIDHKIIVTSLRNLSMPLIRYETGDMASGRGKCSCGRKTPVIERIEGRSIEMFKTKDGKLISGIFFSHLFGVMYPKPEVYRVQAVQDAYNHIILNVVLHDVNNMPYFGDWKDGIRSMMGDVYIDVKFVDELVRLKSGKMPYTWSLVK